MSRRSGRNAVLAAAGAMALAMAREPLDGEMLTKETIPELDNSDPPRILAIDLKSPHYHPCYCRVGVRVDGVERNDIAYYNMDDLSYMTQHKTSHLATSIEPYWRYQASRQQRRAEARHRSKTYG